MQSQTVELRVRLCAGLFRSGGSKYVTVTTLELLFIVYITNKHAFKLGCALRFTPTFYELSRSEDVMDSTADEVTAKYAGACSHIR